MMDGSKDFHGFQYQLQAAPNVTNMASGNGPPPHSTQLSGTSSEPDTSFDSGYFSPSQPSTFTSISTHPRGYHGHLHSPNRSTVSLVGDLGRSSWSDDLSLGVADDWDKSFFDSFEENLFGLDSSDLNHMVEGILRSPLKSPRNSPFKSPRCGVNVVNGLSFSPFKTDSTANIMLNASKRSPGQFGASSFKSSFPSPGFNSPGKTSLSPFTRTSPLTRQQRLLEQSPARKCLSTLASIPEPFPDLPDLTDMKEEMEDDLGVVPFQRQNSFGFTPKQEQLEPSSSPLSGCIIQSPFKDKPFSHVKFKYTGRVNPQESTQHTSDHFNIKTEPSVLDEFDAHSTVLEPKHTSVSRQSQAIATLHSKDALRVVRERFQQVLSKATEDYISKEKNIRQKPVPKKLAQYPEITSALAKPAPVSGMCSMMHNLTTVQSFDQIQKPRTGAKRQKQEIRPKPEPEWPRKMCKIAPKKRKR